MGPRSLYRSRRALKPPRVCASRALCIDTLMLNGLALPPFF
jgi:hypothetical protein